jgi:hypothetical protein
MKIKVTAPLKNFTGTVVGVDFKAGAAEFEQDTDAGRAAYAYFDRAGYRLEHVSEPEPEQQTPPAGDEPFDPSEHSVDEVLAYLDAASLDEAERVVQAESDGKARKGILTQSGPLLASKEGGAQ